LGTGIPTTAFGSQSGTYSSGTSGAAISLSGAGAPTVTAGTGVGATVSATYSGSAQSDVAATSVRRIASSSNDQSTFTATRQGTSFAASGSGLTAVTAGGLGAAAANGAAPTITALVGGKSQANITFTKQNSTLLGQDSVAITASSTNVTQAGYGVVTKHPRWHHRRCGQRCHRLQQPWRRHRWGGHQFEPQRDPEPDGLLNRLNDLACRLPFRRGRPFCFGCTLPRTVLRLPMASICCSRQRARQCLGLAFAAAAFLLASPAARADWSSASS